MPLLLLAKSATNLHKSKMCFCQTKTGWTSTQKGKLLMSSTIFFPSTLAMNLQGALMHMTALCVSFLKWLVSTGNFWKFHPGIVWAVRGGRWRDRGKTCDFSIYFPMTWPTTSTSNYRQWILSGSFWIMLVIYYPRNPLWKYDKGLVGTWELPMK